MTCWLCHGGATRRRRRAWAWPGAQFDYGLLLATAAVLDDANADGGRVPARARLSARSHRARAPAARRAGAAGSDGRVRPGRDRARLPLGALRGDGARPPGDARDRQPDQRPRDPGGAGPGAARTGPVPRTRRRPGWNGWSRSRGRPEPDAIETFGLPDGDRGAARRALLFDLRNLGTLGPAAGFVSGPAVVRRDLRPDHAVGGGDRGDTRDVRRRVGARGGGERNGALAPRGDANEGGDRGRHRARAARSSPSGSSGRSPTARSSSTRHAPTPPRRSTGRCWRRSIRRSRWTRSCRCAAPTATRRRRWRARGRSPRTRRRSGGARTATSRTSSVEEWAPRPTLSPPSGRGLLDCDRVAASRIGRADGGGGVLRGLPREAPGLRAGGVLVEPAVPVRRRRRRRRAGQPGRRPARGRHRHRAAAGVRRARSRSGRSRSTSPSSPTRCAPVHVGHARIGAAWVRAAPLVALRASAPYLHNGSVPTLRALLEPAARRPRLVPARRRRLRARHARRRQRQPGPRVRHLAQPRREAGPGPLPRNAATRRRPGANHARVGDHEVDRAIVGTRRDSDRRSGSRTRSR